MVLLVAMLLLTLGLLGRWLMMLLRSRLHVVLLRGRPCVMLRRRRLMMRGLMVGRRLGLGVMRLMIRRGLRLRVMHRFVVHRGLGVMRRRLVVRRRRRRRRGVLVVLGPMVMRRGRRYMVVARAAIDNIDLITGYDTTHEREGHHSSNKRRDESHRASFISGQHSPIVL